MLTVLAAMRPFHGSIGSVQLNAVRSWLSLGPSVRVVAVDDEEGTTPSALAGLPVTVVREVARSGMGAPRLDDLLRIGARQATGDQIAFITADVLLPPNFRDVAASIHRLMHGRDYFAAGSRFDLTRPADLDFTRADWHDALMAAVRQHGRPHGHTALDLWLFPSSFDWKAPPMPIGRGGMDGWAVWRVRAAGIPFIDFSHDVVLVHQHHERPARRDPRYREEFMECRSHFPSMAKDAMSMLDANWLLVDGALRRPRGARRWHAALSLVRPYRWLIGLRRRWLYPQLYAGQPDFIVGEKSE